MTNLDAGARITLVQARNVWHRAQGLAQPVGKDVVSVVERTGWLRTLGGVEAYIAARARLPGLAGDDVHAAVLRRDLVIAPAVRGCIYLVPASQAGLALHVAETLDWRRTARDLDKVGVSSSELADVGLAVLDVLQAGPLSTSALRRSLPPGLVRSFGDLGKKIGLSSSLPPTLRRLEFDCQVQRTLDDGRIDTERYLWGLPDRNATPVGSVPDNPEAALAEHFCRIAGPVSLNDFVRWSGFGKRVARSALMAAPVVAVSVEGYADEAWVHESAIESLATNDGDHRLSNDGVSFLGFGDNYLGLHGGPVPVTDEALQGTVVPTWGRGGPMPIRDARHVHMRTVFVGTTLAGLWEYDEACESIVWSTFEPSASRLSDSLNTASADMSAFLRDDLGSHKTYSLDSNDTIADRVSWVRRV